METVQSSLSVQIPSQKIADLATIVIPLTKTAMDGLVSASQVSSYKLYLITNADSSTRRLLVKGLTTTTLEDTAIDMSTGEVGTYVLSTDTFTATSGGGNASITPITVAALQALETAGTLSLTTLYIITDATPYKLMCKAEAVNMLSKTATVVDSVYSGTVNYDLQGNTMTVVALSDNGVEPNQYFGVAPITLLAPSSYGNIFYINSDASLGDSCSYNTFEQKANNNILGNNCGQNTFKQGANGFTFGDNLVNVTIESSVNGGDYTATPDYDFLYNNAYASTIFTDGTDNYHRYYDPANDRIVVTLMSAPFTVSYIGGGTPDLQQVLDAGNISTTSFTIDDGTDSTGMTSTAFGLRNSLGGIARIESPNLTVPVNFELPNKAAGTETFAMLSDIVGGGGTVTSVGLSMPSAFSVASSPVTTSGTIAVTGAGLVSQYVRGDGSLANFPSSNGGGASVNYYLNGSVSQGTFGGVAMREANRTPIIGTGTDFTIATNGYIQSFITDANDPNQLVIPAGNWNFETYFSASSGGGSPSFYIELHKWDGATLTLIASNSATPEGITNGTAIDLYFTAIAVPQTTLALTDRLALRIYVNNSGRTITLHTENSHLCQVITTFTTGLTALNGLTEQVQTFAVGTTGTDFAISSASGIHNFNLPTASASNRGALSSADWTAFNGKQAALTNPVTGTGTNNEIAAFNSTGSTITSLSTATYPSLTELAYVKGVTSAIQTQIDNIFDDNDYLLVYSFKSTYNY
jgi:hypothetical protein